MPDPIVQLEPFERITFQVLKRYHTSFGKLLRMWNMSRWWFFDINNSDQMNIPKPVDQVLDAYIVKTFAKINRF